MIGALGSHPAPQPAPAPKHMPAASPPPAAAAAVAPVPRPLASPSPSPSPSPPAESVSLARCRTLPPIPTDQGAPCCDLPSASSSDRCSGPDAAGDDSRSDTSLPSDPRTALDFCVPDVNAGVPLGLGSGAGPSGLSLGRSSSPVPSDPFVPSDSGERSTRPLPAPAPIVLPPPVRVDPAAALGRGDAPDRAPSEPLRPYRGRWEPDDATDECHLCQRAFGLFTRRHHCRACGRVCCAQCTRRRAGLPAHLIVQPPSLDDVLPAAPPPTATHTRSVSVPPPLPPGPDHAEPEPVRVCDECASGLADRARRSSQPASGAYESLPAPSRARQIERSSSPAGAPAHGNVLTQYFSQLSLAAGSPQLSRSLPTQAHALRPRMLECPVCTRLVAPEGDEEALEAHVRACIESPETALLAASGVGPSARPGPRGAAADHSRYARDTLREGNPLIGRECLICMEDFETDDVVARMACLCAFHEPCLRDWLKRGPGCPTHRPPSPGAH